MHLVDGVVSPPVLWLGGAAGLAGVAWGLRALTPEHLPKTALLSAVFYTAALLHLPIGPTSAHLILNGLLGLLLGAAAFPAIFVALLLQALLFGFGGILVLPLNTLNLALPAVVCGQLGRWGLRRVPQARFFWGMGVGGGAVALSAGLVATSLMASDRAFWPALSLLLIGQGSLLVVEMFVTAFAVGLLYQVKPELFAPPCPTSA